VRRVLLALLAGAALTVALAGVQAAVSRHLWGGAVPVSLPMILLAWAALEDGRAEGIAAAVGVGYVLDVFAGTPKGLLVFLCVLAFLAGRTARSSLAVHGAAGFAGLAGAITALVGVGAVLLTRLTAPAAVRPAYSLVGRALLEALLTGGVAALVQPLRVRLGRWRAGPAEAGWAPP
jgi:ABC-type Co2+ transport system permease subunit